MAPPEQGHRLVLFRHAKSAWPPGVPDHDRPLGRRGTRDAPVMGRWLRGASCVPNRVLCSTARRARETWQLTQPALTVAPPVVFDQGIYEGTAAELLALVRRVSAETGTLLLIGHAPAIQDLAVMLVAAAPGAAARTAPDAAGGDDLERMRAKFPTAAIAVLEPAGTWHDLTPGQAWLTAFVAPRDLAGRRRPGS